MQKIFRLLVIAFFVSVIFFTTNAFASSETNGSSRGGEGAATISGWNISNIHYRLAEDPGNIEAVEFDMDGPATQVLIRFDTASDRAFSCYNVSEYHWLCQVEGIELARINSLRVIAVS